jgi:hypothetical protein
MSKKRKNKKFLKKLLAQKMQQQSQPVQPQVLQNQKIKPQTSATGIPETKEIKSSEQLVKEQVVESHDKQIRSIILGDMRRILLILILIAALFTGVFIANQKTTVFSTFSQKLLNLFDQS